MVGFLNKLVRGDFGLAKTFWLFGVVADIVLSVISVVMDTLFSAVPILFYVSLFVFSSCSYLLYSGGNWHLESVG